MLKFTPLEFETFLPTTIAELPHGVKIYSVGVWNPTSSACTSGSHALKFTPLEFETHARGVVNEACVWG